jgi:hypothetical protein
VPDRKPPRFAAGERETLLALLQFQRESLVHKVTGADESAAAVSPVPSGTTLAWLVAHLARAEASWIEERFAGMAARTIPLPEDRPPSITESVAAYRAGWTRVDAIIADGDLDEMCRGDDATPPVNLRWVLAHLLEETARHAGHADILRELLDGTTGR